jgi:hypothetical protein
MAEDPKQIGDSNSSDYYTLEDINRMFEAYEPENHILLGDTEKQGLKPKKQKDKQRRKSKQNKKAKRAYFTKKGIKVLHVTVSFYPPMSVPKEIRSTILARDKKCKQCGTRKKEGLSVHHIDGDHNNDSPENLILLCRSCHGKQKGQ